MIFLKNIFSSYYSFFLQKKSVGPIYATVNLFAIALSSWGLFIMYLIKKFNWFDLFSIPSIKFFYVAFVLLLIFFLYKFYTKEKIKINDRVKVFNTKTTFNKVLWNTISFTFLILPVVLIALSLNKYIF